MRHSQLPAPLSLLDLLCHMILPRSTRAEAEGRSACEQCGAGELTLLSFWLAKWGPSRYVGLQGKRAVVSSTHTADIPRAPRCNSVHKAVPYSVTRIHRSPLSTPCVAKEVRALLGSNANGSPNNAMLTYGVRLQRECAWLPTWEL